MLLSERLAENVRACFTGIWIQSHEHDEALLEITRLCHSVDWGLLSWDIDRGLHGTEVVGESDTSYPDPLAAIHSLNSQADPDRPTLLVLKNFHRFINSPEIIQALTQQISLGKQTRTFVIVLSSLVQIPTELEKLFVCLEHDLPDRSQLEEIARSIATETGELPNGPELERVLDAACGLTRYEAEGAFSLSLVRHGRIDVSVVLELKAQTLLKSGLLTLHSGSESFDDLGGLESLKAFCRRALRPRSQESSAVRPRGVLLLGVPGTGKSAFAKALGKETGRSTLTLDVGALMGALVGQTEERTRQALRIVDAMQPAVLFIDEVEKGLSGAASSGQSDSGVSTRMLGTLLSWLNDHTSDVFVVCTANDISKLPPELIRAERFDGLFFLDLPGDSQKQMIWNIYREQYGLTEDQELPEDRHWTGSEIRACCRLAALLDVPLIQAAENVVPVAVTAAESVARLRRWASNRCLSAEQPGVFVHGERSEGRAQRKLSRDPRRN
ncbi:AAA family ATPase [Gimesia maris]|uniref:AAA family ATPase n=1 Tax=Gimesia maris TaxID=122 RepID=UPI00241DBA71|nr:AAA family ATPase [Gimesia maris]|tara:strand:- start:4325 stop:5821 length:1497 start_codon:yes stop_codon:yes gene_type:complete